MLNTKCLGSILREEIGRPDQPDGRMAGQSAQQSPEERPASFIVNPMVGQETGRLVDIERLEPPPAEMPDEPPEDRAFADKAAPAMPIDGIDMDVNLDQAFGKGGIFMPRTRAEG